MTDEDLKRRAKETAEKISDSAIFCCLFNEHMIEEVDPVLQMGLAVYLDKPIYLLVPEGTELPENIKRLARGIEFYDRSLPEVLMQTSVEAATARLLAGAQELKP